MAGGNCVYQQIRFCYIIIFSSYIRMHNIVVINVRAYKYDDIVFKSTTEGSFMKRVPTHRQRNWAY